tara:strand:- start:750 stop:1520 length:771 start_codon:yes stop_codon:yes gene_type:complete
MNYKKFLIKYSLEFIVIVIGISFSFWIDEWNKTNTNKVQHLEDLRAVLNDLKNDSIMFNRVQSSLDEGKINTDRLLLHIESYNSGQMTYKSYADSIIDTGFLYGYSTFFMTSATFESLISNGRIILFPEKIHSEMNNYYEAISKRIIDNNHILDNISLDYYNDHHPFSMYYANITGGYDNNSTYFEAKSANSDQLKRFRKYFQNQEIKNKYNSIDFLINTSNLRNRIQVYDRQIKSFREQRDIISNSIKIYFNSIK